MSSRNLSILLLPTLQCNCNCSYCLEHHSDSKWNKGQTTFILRSIFDFAKEIKFDSIRLDWQGGEPLLFSDDYWTFAFSLAEELADAKEINLTQAMQTNLILYRSSLKNLIHSHLRGFLGSSFELTDARRLAGEENGLFRTKWTAAYERALTDGISVGILSLIDDRVIATGAKETLSLLYNDYSIGKLRFTLPTFSDATNRGFLINPEHAGMFLAEAYMIWVQNGRDEWMHIKPFASIEKMILGESNHERICFFSSDCTRLTLTVLPDGNVTLCGNFVSDTTRIYGNIFEENLIELYNGSKQREIFGEILSMRSEDCELCRYLFICNGGCLARSYSKNKSETRHYHYCKTYKIMLSTIENYLIPRS